MHAQRECIHFRSVFDPFINWFMSKNKIQLLVGFRDI